MNAEQILDNILKKMTTEPGSPLSETFKAYRAAVDFVDQCMKEMYKKGEKAGELKKIENIKSQN